MPEDAVESVLVEGDVLVHANHTYTPRKTAEIHTHLGETACRKFLFHLPGYGDCHRWLTRGVWTDKPPSCLDCVGTSCVV